MEPITFSQCLDGAWQDAFRAFKKMPLMFALIVLINLALMHHGDQILLRTLQTGALSQSNGSHRLLDFTFRLAYSLMMYVAVAYITVRVTRLTLSGDKNTRPIAIVLRYILLYLIFAGVAVGGMALAGVALAIFGRLFHLVGWGRGPWTILAFLVMVPAVVSFWFASTRLILLFPHVANGGGRRWRNAWDDTRGHVWSIYGTLFLTLLPVALLSGFLAIGRALILKLQPETQPIYIGCTILITVTAAFTWALGATSLCWIYKRYAKTLLQI